MGNKYYRTNQFIRAIELRVIGEDGKQVGVLPVNEALDIAREKGLDLVEIAPAANPPVAKIIDFKKFLYQEEKKEREEKKKNKKGEIKGIRLTPFIAQGDLEVRLKRTEEFLKEGNKVRLTVRFKGRQLGKREFGFEILKKATQVFEGIAITEGEPKWMGRDLSLTLSPIKNKSKEVQEVKNEPETQDTKINNETV